MAYGVPQGWTYPVIGVDTVAVGASKLQTILQSIEGTLNSKVTPSAIDINTDLSLQSGGTFYGLTDAHRIALSATGALAPATYPRTLYVDSGELWYNDAAGNNVRITTGGAVDAGAAGAIIDGGTSPSYGTSGVELRWDGSTTDRFTFKDGSLSTDFADVRMGQLELASGASTAAKVIAPSAVAYTLTLPSALPGSTLPLTVTSGGVVEPNGALSITSLTTTGAISGGSTITAASGLIATTGGASLTGTVTTTGNMNINGGTLTVGSSAVFSAGATAAANQHITISGTGRYKHGDYSVVVPVPGNVASITESGAATTNIYLATMPFVVGSRVKSVVFRVGSSGHTVASGKSYTIEVQYTTTGSWGTPTSIGSKTEFEDDTPTTQTIDLTDTTITQNMRFRVLISNNLSGCTITMHAMTFTYDYV